MKNLIIMSVLFLTGCGETFAVTNGEGGAPGDSGVGGESSTGGSVVSSGGSSSGGSTNGAGSSVSSGGITNTCSDPRCDGSSDIYKCGYELLIGSWDKAIIDPDTVVGYDFPSITTIPAESPNTCGGGCLNTTRSDVLNVICPFYYAKNPKTIALYCPFNDNIGNKNLGEIDINLSVIKTVNNCITVNDQEGFGSAWCCNIL